MVFVEITRKRTKEEVSQNSVSRQPDKLQKMACNTNAPITPLDKSHGLGPFLHQHLQFLASQFIIMQSSQHITPSPSTPQSGWTTYSPVGNQLTQVPPPHIDVNMIHNYL